MATLAAVRAGLVTALEAAGLRVTTDPRNVNPPCVLVGLATGSRLTGCAWEGSVPVQAIAPGAGHGDAASWLDDTAATICATIPGAIAQSGDTYDLPGSPGALLAYTVTVNVAWSVTE